MPSSRIVSIIAATVLSFGCANSLTAGSIDFSSGGQLVLDENELPAQVGNLVRLGTFQTAFDFQANQADFGALDAAFTEFGLATIGFGFDDADVGPGQFEAAAGNLFEIEGLRLYIWMFNAASSSAASAWAIVTNDDPNWEGPADASFTIAELSAPGTYVPTGALGVITAEGDVQMQAIPEPGSIALLIVGLTSLAALRRRVRR